MPRDDNATFLTLGTLDGKAGRLAPVWGLRGVPADTALGMRETNAGGNRPSHEIVAKLAGQIVPLAALWESDRGAASHSGKLLPEAAAALGLPQNAAVYVFPPREDSDTTAKTVKVKLAGDSGNGASRHPGADDPFDEE